LEFELLEAVELSFDVESGVDDEVGELLSEFAFASVDVEVVVDEAALESITAVEDELSFEFVSLELPFESELAFESLLPLAFVIFLLDSLFESLLELLSSLFPLSFALAIVDLDSVVLFCSFVCRLCDSFVSSFFSDCADASLITSSA